MTYVAYFAILVAAILVFFLLTHEQDKRERDFQIMTGLIMIDVFAGAALALNYLEVI